MLTFSTTNNESVTVNVDRISLYYNAYSNIYAVIVDNQVQYQVTKGQYDILLMYLNPSDFRI
jgi:hypothetical protein